MFNLKKFDKLVYKAFIGPYMMSFFVAVFVLVMQFLWKHIDDIIGKGYSLFQLLELCFYFAVVQIPMALPISILISSVMVFGNMSEKYELSSVKSAGVSLLRIMRPGIVLAVLTTLLSLLASNYLKPSANFRFEKRFRAIQSQKPSLTLEEKIFNKDFRGYAVRVGSKGEDGESIKEVMLYDHTKNDKSLVNLITADSGRMYNNEVSGAFVMDLHKGTMYNEPRPKRSKNNEKKRYPFIRTSFDTWQKKFDMSEFNTDDDGVNISRNREDMLNSFQLSEAIDSVDRFKAKINKELFDTYFDQQIRGEIENEETAESTDKNKPKSLLDKAHSNELSPKIKKKIALQLDTIESVESFFHLMNAVDQKKYARKAMVTSGRIRDNLNGNLIQLKSNNKKKDRYLLRLHQQLAFAFICLVFMFVGAPLGSIIRKGGYGYPLLIAIVFYMIFIIMSIMGDKLVRSSSMDPVLAAWISNIIVLPIGILLTYMALKDKSLRA